MRSESEHNGAGLVPAPFDSGRALAPFDYRSLGAVAKEVRAEVNELRPLLKRQTDDMLEIGHRLTRLKAKVGHGPFCVIVETELHLHRRIAQQFMKAHAEFGGKSEVISLLTPTAVIEMTSAPKPVQDEVLRRVEAGETVKIEEIKQLKKEARKAEAPVEPVKAITPQSPILVAHSEPERAGPALQAPEPVAPDADDLVVQLTTDLRAANGRIEALEAELEMERSKVTDAAIDEEIGTANVIQDFGRLFGRVMLRTWSALGIDPGVIKLVDDWIDVGDLDDEIADAVEGPLYRLFDKVCKEAKAKLKDGPEPPEDGDDDPDGSGQPEEPEAADDDTVETVEALDEPKPAVRQMAAQPAAIRVLGLQDKPLPLPRSEPLPPKPGLPSFDKVESLLRTPKGMVVAPDPWRMDIAKNSDVVTVFRVGWQKPKGVEAFSGRLYSLVDQRSDDGRRIIEAGYLGRHGKQEQVLGFWPAWFLVVRGNHVGAGFPTEPDLFDHWFRDWSREKAVGVVADWRSEARADGWKQ